MVLQTFLFVQLGTFALGLTLAMGWRSWQMRRQLALLTESLNAPEAATPAKSEAPTAAAEPEPEPEVADEPAATESEPATAEVEQEESAQEAIDEPEAAEEVAEPELSDQAEDGDSESDFEDLDALLDPDPPAEEATNSAAQAKDEAEAAEATAPEAPTPEEPQPSPPATEPEAEENGLRALVTKFAAENRQLLEQVHDLEDEIKRLESERDTDAAAQIQGEETTPETTTDETTHAAADAATAEPTDKPTDEVNSSEPVAG